MADQSERLAFDGLSISFGERLAVDAISATIHSGEAVAVIGPNGAGKTTLMRAVVGLVEPTAGTVRVLGGTADANRSKVAWVQQSASFDASFPVSAYEVALMGRYRSIGWFSRPSSSDRSIATDALERVGMTEHGKRQFGELSGGQRQRVLLARAIAQQSQLLLMDEPFNGVDATTVEVCLGVLRQLRDEGTSVLLSTHDMDVARAVCSRVLLMNARQVAFGDLEQVLTADLMREAFGSKSAAWTRDGSIVTTC